MSGTSQLLTPALTLTGSPVASAAANLSGMSQHSIYIEYTPGAGSNVLTVTVETSRDGTTWTQDQAWTNSSGTLSQQLLSLVYTASGTSLVPLVYDFPRIARFLRIKFSETGVTKGSITAEVLSNFVG